MGRTETSLTLQWRIPDEGVYTYKVCVSNSNPPNCKYTTGNEYTFEELESGGTYRM